MNISIIIPVHNEVARLPESLRPAIAYLKTLPYSFEIILVENGSTDGTWEMVQQYAKDYSFVRAMRELVAGKGNAVRAGMLAATGDYRFICDADFSMPIEELSKFLDAKMDEADVIIGSRYVPGSKLIDFPRKRQLSSRVFNSLVRFLVLPEFHDTQCGFKCFRAAAAEQLFTEQTITGFAFDVELLCLAKKHGYCVKEIPIEWKFIANSRVSLLKDAWKMARDVWKIRGRLKKARFNNSNIPQRQMANKEIESLTITENTLPKSL